MKRKVLPFAGRLLLLAVFIIPLSCQDDLTDEVKPDLSAKNGEMFISFEEAQEIASSVSFDSASEVPNA